MRHERLTTICLAMGFTLLVTRGAVAAGIRVPASHPSGPTATSRPAELVWHLGSSHSADRIPWPAGPTNRVSCLFEIGKRLRIETGPDLFIEGDVTRASAARTGDQLVYVSVSFEKQTAEATRASALAIANAFAIPNEKIDAWWQAVRENRGWVQSTLAARRGSEPTYDLEIHHSFNDEQPWFISFTVGWPSAMPPPRGGATTNPSK